MLKIFTRSGLPNWLVLFTFPPINKEGLPLLPRLGPDLLKQFPGVVYSPAYGHGIWQAPIEAIPWLKQCAQVLGLGVDDKNAKLTPLCPPEWKPAPGLHSYQIDTIDAVLSDRVHLASLDMGLGKTAVGICTLRSSETVRSTLIVAPAVAIPGWLREFNRWWPNWVNALPINWVKSGKDMVPDKGVTLISWGLLRYQQEKLLDKTYDAIILDESHYVCKSRSQRTKIIEQIRNKNGDALYLALTGTPIGDSPRDLWKQLDILFPNRFGSWTRFCERYCNRIKNDYSPRGYVYVGLNDRYKKELQARMTYVSTRVVKSEVAHLLPKITITTDRIDGLGLCHGKVTENTYNTWLKSKAVTEPKVKHAIEWVENQHACGVNHVCVMTYLRQTAHDIAKGTKGLLIDGSIEAAVREEKIREAYLQRESTVVCTMSSCGVAINALANFSVVSFAELAYYPVTVLQAIARFHRLNSKEPSFVTFLVSENGPDQKLAYALEQKIKTNTDIFNASGSESALLQGLGGKDDWQTRLLDRLFSLDDEEESDGY